jgi:uncharacterized OsmC-like protein
MTAPATTIRTYDISARSTDVFGRVLVSARNNHFVVDGPVQNGCPGEALTPAELLLSAVAGCGVELIAVIAKDEGKKIGAVSIQAHGVVDRGNQARTDRTVFNSIRLIVSVETKEKTTAAELVEGFKRRCPIFGTIATAVADTKVEVVVV